MKTQWACAASRVQFVLLAVMLLCWTGCNSQSNDSDGDNAAQNPTAKTVVNQENLSPSRVITRLFWQDRNDGIVYVGDLARQGNGYQVAKSKVENFPSLSPSVNDLVQMEIANGRLFVGVRDHSDGKENSGWIEINTGVEEEQHGDHSHWHYPAKAKVHSATLDKEQGNPAHMYQYGNCIYIANDKNNGFTQVQPPQDGGLSDSNSETKFYTGGGGHITMAAVADRIAYSTWIDRSGKNAGRVDVVELKGDPSEPRYSFNLPVGGIHGAAACGNRVYFAPANGVYWVNCDFDFAENRDTVKIEYLSLDEDPSDTEYRTGAFHSFHNHLFCIANSKSGEPVLCVIDATVPQPSVTRVSCGELKGAKLSSVNATSVVGGQSFAFAFAEGDGLEEKLLIFDLDPNGDKCFDDAKLLKAVEIGASQLVGHFGHHGITFLDDRKTAVVTNPGDGTLTVVDVKTQSVTQTVSVGGQPTKIISFGAAN
jgi:YVTN family beta-propeller protein